MLKIKDKVKTGYGIGIIVDIKHGVYSNKDINFYLIKYEDNEELWAMKDSVEKIEE